MKDLFLKKYHATGPSFDYYKKLLRKHNEEMIEALSGYIVYNSKHYIVVHAANLLTVFSTYTGRVNAMTSLYYKKLAELFGQEKYMCWRWESMNEYKRNQLYDAYVNHISEMRYTAEQLQQKSIKTIDDVIAENIINTKFLPIDIDSSIECNTRDLASNSRITRNRKKGVSLESFVESLIESASTNGLQEIGYCSERDFSTNSDTFRRLRLDIQSFITTYSGVTHYFSLQKSEKRDLEELLKKSNIMFYEKTGCMISPIFEKFMQCYDRQGKKSNK